jgi:hypothetical protein
MGISTCRDFFFFFESADASENPNLVYTAIKGQVAAMDRIVIAVKTTAENRPRIGLYAARGANWFQPSLDVAVQAQITYRCSHFVATFLQVSNSRPEMTKDGVNDLLYFVLSEVLLGADICTPDRVEFCFLEHDTSAAHARNDTIRYQVHQCLSDSLPHVLREKLRCGDFRDLLDSLYPVLSYANKKEEESERNGSSLDHFKKQRISEFAQDVITRGLEELPKEARLHHFHHICNVLEEQQKGTIPFLFPTRYLRSRFAKRS